MVYGISQRTVWSGESISIVLNSLWHSTLIRFKIPFQKRPLYLDNVHVADDAVSETECAAVQCPATSSFCDPITPPGACCPLCGKSSVLCHLY